MAKGDAFTLDNVNTRCRNIQQYIYQVIVEQVHLIHIKNTSIGIGQNSGLKTSFPLFYGLLYVQGANNPILGSSQGEVNNRRLLPGYGQLFTFFRSFAAVITQGSDVLWVAVETASLYHLNLWHDRGEAAYSSRFGRALLAANQYPSQKRIDDVQDESHLHLVLPDDSGEWKINHSFLN
jgi:hypothetical protein